MSELSTPDSNFTEIMTLRARGGRQTNARQVLAYLNATRAGTVKIYRNHLDVPVSYIVWACVVKETAAAFLKHGLVPTYPYEWNEGRICVVVEVLNSGSQEKFSTHVRAFLREHRAVAWLRNQMTWAYLRHATVRRKRKYRDLSTAKEHAK